MDQMSASTRIAQRTLGTSQLGGMLVLLAVLATIVVALAFGSIGAKPAAVEPAAGFAAPVVRDLGSRDGINAQQGAGYWQPDGRGGLEFVPTLGKSANEYPSLGGWNHPPVRSGEKGSLRGFGRDAR
jgi:hypothetical protein